MVDGEGAEESGARMGIAEVKIWVLEAEMWVIVVVEVEVQVEVAVTYLVAAWAEAARRVRRRGRRGVVVGWRIVGDGGTVRARKVWWCAVVAVCIWFEGVFVVRARWEGLGFCAVGGCCAMRRCML